MGTCQDFKRNKLVPLPVIRDAVSSIAGLTDAFVVAMEQWTVAHRAFVVLKRGNHGLHVLLTSQRAITFFGGTSSLSVPCATT
jgi:hypothetical protein